MSIYAKTEMETMPGSCTECKFGRRYGCVGDVKCRILNEYFTGNVEPPYKERPDVCPLTEMEEKRLIVLPCKIGTHLWRVTYPYRQSPKITEYIVRNFRTVTKKNKLQIEVRAINVPISNWMYYDDFYTTREEAEAALAEMQGTVSNPKQEGT